LESLGRVKETVKGAKATLTAIKEANSIKPFDLSLPGKFEGLAGAPLTVRPINHYGHRPPIPSVCLDLPSVGRSLSFPISLGIRR
jgi:hypothetical protein